MASLPRGSLLRRSPSQLSIISYNLLAPLYVRPVDERTGTVQAFAAFPWAEPFDEVLAWESRRPALLAELVAAEADIVCLQEVQFERRADGVHELPGWLRLSGYEYVIPAQEQMAQMAARNARVLRSCTAIGNALLYRTDRLMDVDAKKPRADATTRVCMCLRGRPATALEPLGPLAVFSVHLDATKETTRVKQLSKCVEMAVDTFGTRAVLIAGDMNSELARGSCVAALVGGAHDGTVAAPTQAELQRECASALRLSTDDGAAEDDSDTRGDDAEAASPAEGGGGGSPMPTAEQMQAWQQLYDAAQRVPRAQRVRLERVPTGATRAAYAHGAMVGPCELWKLDHILYSPRALTLSQHWSTLEAAPEASESGLPCRGFPSDHLSVAASFDVSTMPALEPAAREALLARVQELLEAQAKQRTAAEAQAAEEAAAVEAKEQSAAAAAATTGSSDGVPASVAAAAAAAAAAAGPKANKKAKKQGRGPPSAEMQALLRAKRERERALKNEQREERVRFLAACSELELDALEESLAIERLEPLAE